MAAPATAIAPAQEVLDLMLTTMSGSNALSMALSSVSMPATLDQRCDIVPVQNG
jgi:hypothetical protein